MVRFNFSIFLQSQLSTGNLTDTFPVGWTRKPAKGICAGINLCKSHNPTSSHMGRHPPTLFSASQTFLVPIKQSHNVTTSASLLWWICLFIYLGFYVAFNTVQVISRRVVGRAEETSTYSSLGLCTVNCRPTASNYQLSHLRQSRGSNPRPQRWEARVLPLCHRGPSFVMNEKDAMKSQCLDRKEVRMQTLWPVLPVVYTGRLFLAFGGTGRTDHKAIVHWIGCINAIKWNNVLIIHISKNLKKCLLQVLYSLLKRTKPSH